MKISRFIGVSLMLGILISSFSQVSEAQTRRRVRVVRHTVRPVHRVRHHVVVRHAHVRYSNLPRWGAAVTVLPAAAIVVSTHNNRYHLHNGVFYAPRANNFVVVRPVVGVRVRSLPAGYRTVVVAKRNYYYYYGTFYTKTTNNLNEYEVVDAPVGAVVDALPDGYEVKKVNNIEYYVLDNVYYAEVDTDEVEDGVGYEVVKV